MRILQPMMHEAATVAVLVLALAGIGAGRLPVLEMNRAAIAMAAAAVLVTIGSISLEEALAAIDTGTIVLLLSMMVVVASVRVSGAFDIVAFRMAGLAATPLVFLAAIVVVSGVLSALFLNDTMCLVLAPIVAETSLRARRDPVPYLVATATAANVGSAATIIGNPQNMLIGARSGIAFADFLMSMLAPSLLGLLVCWMAIVVVFPREFLFRARSGSTGLIASGRTSSADATGLGKIRLCYCKSPAMVVSAQQRGNLGRPRLHGCRVAAVQR